MIKAGFKGFEIGDDRPLGLIGGPCVIESEEICLEVGYEAKRICEKLGIQYVFKASFDKANRTSVESFRGPGLEKGLEILASVKSKLRKNRSARKKRSAGPRKRRQSQRRRRIRARASWRSICAARGRRCREAFLRRRPRNRGFTLRRNSRSSAWR